MPQNEMRIFDRIDTIKGNGDLYYLPSPTPPITTLLHVGDDADELIGLFSGESNGPGASSD